MKRSFVEKVRGLFSVWIWFSFLLSAEVSFGQTDPDINKDQANRFEALLNQYLAIGTPTGEDREELISFGPSKIDSLVKTARSVTGESRARVIFILGRLWMPGEKRIDEEFCCALTDSDDRVRITAANLITWGVRAKCTIPILCSIVSEDKWGSVTRQEAATALGSFGKDAADVVHPLDRLLRNRKTADSVRAACAEAIGSIDSNNPGVAASLIAVLRDQQTGPRTRFSAAAAIGAVKGGQTAMPLLLEFLRKADPTDPSDEATDLQRAAIHSISKLDAPKEAVAILVAAFERPDGALRARDVLICFAHMGKSAKAAARV